jgi:hypothetical protein
VPCAVASPRGVIAFVGDVCVALGEGSWGAPLGWMRRINPRCDRPVRSPRKGLGKAIGQFSRKVPRCGRLLDVVALPFDRASGGGRHWCPGSGCARTIRERTGSLCCRGALRLLSALSLNCGVGDGSARWRPGQLLCCVTLNLCLRISEFIGWCPGAIIDSLDIS